MEEVKNLTQDGVLEVIKDFPLQPLRNRVIITMNVDSPDGEVILSNNSFSETQFVVAKGSFVKEIEVGQRVLLDLEKMTETTPDPENGYETISRVKLKVVEVNGRMYAMIFDNFIDAADNREY